MLHTTIETEENDDYNLSIYQQIGLNPSIWIEPILDEETLQI